MLTSPTITEQLGKAEDSMPSVQSYANIWLVRMCVQLYSVCECGQFTRPQHE